MLWSGRPVPDHPGSTMTRSSRHRRSNRRSRAPGRSGYYSGRELGQRDIPENSSIAARDACQPRHAAPPGVVAGRPATNGLACLTKTSGAPSGSTARERNQCIVTIHRPQPERQRPCRTRVAGRSGPRGPRSGKVAACLIFQRARLLVESSVQTRRVAPSPSRSPAGNDCDALSYRIHRGPVRTRGARVEFHLPEYVPVAARTRAIAVRSRRRFRRRLTPTTETPGPGMVPSHGLAMASRTSEQAPFRPCRRAL